MNIRIVLTATAAIAFTSGAALANEKPTSNVTPTIIPLEDTDDIISIPLDTSLDVKHSQNQKMEKGVQRKYEKNYTSKVSYDLFGNIDADIGVLKAKDVNRRYRVTPALQPRGRYFKPPNSKLGAGISSKF